MEFIVGIDQGEQARVGIVGRLSGCFEKEEFVAVGDEAKAGLGGAWVGEEIGEGLGNGSGNGKVAALGFDNGKPELVFENEDIDATTNEGAFVFGADFDAGFGAQGKGGLVEAE